MLSNQSGPRSRFMFRLMILVEEMALGIAKEAMFNNLSVSHVSKLWCIIPSGPQECSQRKRKDPLSSHEKQGSSEQDIFKHLQESKWLRFSTRHADSLWGVCVPVWPSSACVYIRLWSSTVTQAWCYLHRPSRKFGVENEFKNVSSLR